MMDAMIFCTSKAAREGMSNQRLESCISACSCLALFDSLLFIWMSIS